VQGPGLAPALRASVDAGEQVLAPRDGAGDGGPDQVGGRELGHPEVGDGQPLPGQDAVEHAGRPVDGVALRHGS